MAEVASQGSGDAAISPAEPLPPPLSTSATKTSHFTRFVRRILKALFLLFSSNPKCIKIHLCRNHLLTTLPNHRCPQVHHPLRTTSQIIRLIGRLLQHQQ